MRLCGKTTMAHALSVLDNYGKNTDTRIQYVKFIAFPQLQRLTWMRLMVTVYVFYLSCFSSYACVVHTLLRPEFCTCFVFIPYILHAPNPPPFVNITMLKSENYEFFRYTVLCIFLLLRYKYRCSDHHPGWDTWARIHISLSVFLYNKESVLSSNHFSKWICFMK
jgi:hypothetical protein